MAIKGIPLPLPRLGLTPAASSKIFFWQPGTTTKQNAYTDETLATPLSNPLSADSAGLFPAIYLDPALGYKVAWYPSSEINDPPTGTATFSQDNLYLPAASYLFPQLCQGRLTLTSGTPVTNSDVTAATTLYFTPVEGNRIALYNTTKECWELHAFAELSITLVGLTASTPYDVWVYSNSGTPTLELTAWSSATARATALQLQDGVNVKSGLRTRRYVGTIYINSTGGQSDDTLAKRYLFNQYNQAGRDLFRHDGTDTWTYTTATVRQANGATANKVEVMTGTVGPVVDLTVIHHVRNTNTAVAVNTGIGLDSTTVYHANSIGGRSSIALANSLQQIIARCAIVPNVGLHAYNWLEYSEATGTSTWAGDNGTGANGDTKSGLAGAVRM